MNIFEKTHETPKDVVECNECGVLLNIRKAQYIRERSGEPFYLCKLHEMRVQQDDYYTFYEKVVDPFENEYWRELRKKRHGKKKTS